MDRREMDAQQEHGVFNRLDKIEEGIESLLRAFPDGVEGHRQAHIVMIEDFEERKKMRIAITEKTLSGLVWALIVAVGSAIWMYTKDHLK